MNLMPILSQLSTLSLFGVARELPHFHRGNIAIHVAFSPSSIIAINCFDKSQPGRGGGTN